MHLVSFCVLPSFHKIAGRITSSCFIQNDKSMHLTTKTDPCNLCFASHSADQFFDSCLIDCTATNPVDSVLTIPGCGKYRLIFFGNDYFEFYLFHPLTVISLRMFQGLHQCITYKPPILSPRIFCWISDSSWLIVSNLFYWNSNIFKYFI